MHRMLIVSCVNNFVMFQALLSAPNPDDPLANDVAELWKVKLFFFMECQIFVSNYSK